MGTWHDFTDEQYWSGSNVRWDTDHWVVENEAGNRRLGEIGTWVEDYTFTKIKITFTCTDNATTCAVWGTGGAAGNDTINEPSDEFNISLGAGDLEWVGFGLEGEEYDVTKIELWTETTYAEVTAGAGMGDGVEAVVVDNGYMNEEARMGMTVRGFLADSKVTAGAGMGATAEAVNLGAKMTAGAGAGAAAEAGFGYAREVTAGAGMGDSVGYVYAISKAVSAGAGVGATAEGFNFGKWYRDNIDKAVALFYCTLTGAADGETDIEIPIKSFQARARDGNPTYLAAVIHGDDYATEINARSNGEIVIEMAYSVGGSISVREEILRAELEDIIIYEGPNSKSITLSGHKTESYAAKTVTLRGMTYRNLTDGKLTYRCAVPDLYLRPGDTVNAGDDSFTADFVSYTIGESQKTMEVQEA